MPILIAALKVIFITVFSILLPSQLEQESVFRLSTWSVLAIGLESALKRDIGSRVLIMEVDSGIAVSYEKGDAAREDDPEDWPEMFGKILCEGLIG